MVIKAMLVDINPEVVSFYKNYFKASFPLVRVVVSLSEAAEAKFFDAIESKQPNLIVMDIRFFGFSTPRVIADFAARYPNIKLLVLGTYDDHDYLRAAMERGAADFLYKPVKPREIELCMERILKMFEEQEQKKREEGLILREYEQNTSLFRDRFLTNLLGGVLANEEEIAESMEYFGMKIAPPFTVFTLRIDHFKQVIEGMAEKDKHMLIYRVFFAAQRFLNDKGLGYAFINSFNSISCIIGGLRDLPELMAVCEEAKKEVEKKADLSATIGLGRPVEALSGVNVSAKEADAALRYRYLLGYNTVIPIEFAEPENRIGYRYPAKKENLLVYTAVAGEFEYAKNLLNQIFEALGEPAVLPQRILPKIVMNMVIAISRYAGEQGMDIETRFREFFDFSEILNLSQIDEAQIYMEHGLEGFCAFVASKRRSKAERMVASIIKHINAQYYEDLSAEKLALEMKTTPQYLERNFKDAMKVNISGFITDVRMKHAKEILSAEDVEDDVVAARVGYRDVRIFRSIFRRREGMTPREFSRVVR